MSFIGVDLGGTKVAVAVLDEHAMGESAQEPTELGSADALVEQLARMIAAAGSADAVGIGVPSVVEFATGRVVSSVNIPLADVPLREVLSARVGIPVFVDNDATVAALAEAHDHDLRLSTSDLVMLTVGTGIGGGIVLGGRIFRGSTGGAGELGHTLVGLDLSGRVAEATSFPQPGSLEAVAAGHALDRLAARAASEHPDCTLGRSAAEGRPVLGADVVLGAREGDAVAGEVVEIWAEHLGVGIANAINTFDPEEVVIGGGAAQAGELLLDPARRVADAYVHPGLRGHATIRLARHGVGAGVLGAALLASHESAPGRVTAP